MSVFLNSGNELAKEWEGAASGLKVILTNLENPGLLWGFPQRLQAAAELTWA